jgi:four helix bundle protein
VQDLRERTKKFALRIIKLYSALPNSTEAQVIGKQLLRSGTSVAANYREATRGRSDHEYISKLGIVEQELDETILWLELLIDAEIMAKERLHGLLSESDELIRIVVTCITSTRKRIQKQKSQVSKAR